MGMALRLTTKQQRGASKWHVQGEGFVVFVVLVAACSFPCPTTEQETAQPKETKSEVPVAALTNSNVVDAARGWVADPNSTFEMFGHISSWDVSAVTDMSSLFHPMKKFKDDISAWDVSSVTTMKSMFLEASEFNQDILAWNLSSVTVMGKMFGDTSSFNKDISASEFSSVKHMNSAFL
jgi:surface protein